jgi:hypothetical protein
MSLEDWAVISATPASGDEQTRKVSSDVANRAKALIEIGLRIHDWISNDKRATFDRAVDGRMSRTRDTAD